MRLTPSEAGRRADQRPRETLIERRGNVLAHKLQRAGYVLAFRKADLIALRRA